jgi:hypothetical protein
MESKILNEGPADQEMTKHKSADRHKLIHQDHVTGHKSRWEGTLQTQVADELVETL